MAPRWRTRRRPPSWDVLRLSTSVILHFLAACEVPFRFFDLDIWATESNTRSFNFISPRQTLGVSASLAGFVPALPNKGNTVSRFRTVVLVNTSSTSPSSREVANVAPSCSNRQKFLARQLDPNFLDACGMLQFDRKRQTTPWPPTGFFLSEKTFSLSRKGTTLQHDRFHCVVVSRSRSFVVVCRLHFRVPQHQATDTQVRLLGARDIEYRAFEHQHFLRQDCVCLDRRRRLWCEGQHVLSACCRLRP